MNERKKNNKCMVSIIKKFSIHGCSSDTILVNLNNKIIFYMKIELHFNFLKGMWR